MKKTFLVVGVIIVGLNVYAGSCGPYKCTLSTNGKDCGDGMCCNCCCTKDGYAVCGTCATCGEEKDPSNCDSWG